MLCMDVSTEGRFPFVRVAAARSFLTCSSRSDESLLYSFSEIHFNFSLSKIAKPFSSIVASADPLAFTHICSLVLNDVFPPPAIT